MNSEYQKDRSEEEVLLAFFVEPTHDRKTLEQYLTDFPEHAKALINCSIELMVDEARNVKAVETSEGTVDRAWQRFQSVVNQPGEASVHNPFATLNPTAFKSLAKKLDINNLLLIRLRDRAIVATTIPLRFVQRLGAELGTTTDALMDFLRSPPTIVSGHSFRSTIKPAVTKQISFENAVETSQLTPEQQETLKAMQD